jgi:ADP-heptose:LPS heptosyltransferase
MLTAAVRDLHLTCPGGFQTDVRTPCPELWEHNPSITPLEDGDPSVERIECHYPLIHQSNHSPYHFIHGFRKFLAQRLGVEIRPHAFHGDVHLTDEEKDWLSQVDEITGTPDSPFWIIVAGGKTDYTAKWWDPDRYQAVVDHFAGRIQFVQCGEDSAGHVHPLLRGVINLVGKTDLRQMVRLMHHANGVVCPVTMHMHLAAAVETRRGRPRNRPCVVIAGGREPSHWEAYPHHQFLHTNGCLPCCDNGGCWKSRVEPLGDGDEKDSDLCLLPIVTPAGRKLPRCLDLITIEQVIDAIERYLAFDSWECPAEPPAAPARKPPRRRTAEAVSDWRPEPALTRDTARWRLEHAAAELPAYPGGHEGRGIVIPGGGRYFACAWVCINRLRELGCTLPIELWHLGPGEMTDRMRQVVEPLGIQCVDAFEVRSKHPVRLLKTWELKPYAILRSRFKEVLLLDADNVPVVDPTFLFESREYHARGAVFWPDYGRFAPAHPAWELTGVPQRDEPEFESGQIVVDKERCWRPLMLTMWMNEHSDFWYQFVHGDKDTFRLAWHKLGVDFAMIPHAIHSLYITGRLDGVMCQHDSDGRRIFQHRNFGKWTLNGECGNSVGFLGNAANLSIPEFEHERECFACLERLRRSWGAGSTTMYCDVDAAEDERAAARRLCGRTWIYHRIGHDCREMGFCLDGTIAPGEAGCEWTWGLERIDGEPSVAIHGKEGLTCILVPNGRDRWRGAWLIHERANVELIEAASAVTH